MLRSIDKLLGFAFRARDGEAGEVADVIFDDRSWEIRYLVADTGSWLAGRQTLLAPEAAGTPDFDAGELPVSLTREQVENAPDLDTAQPVSRQKLRELHDYYGWSAWWSGYWVGGPAPGVTGFAPPVPPGAEDVEPEPDEETQADPHLRSAREVLGYHIEATDGEIGHVEDFLISPDDWSIYYLVVDTRNLLPGRKVLVAPAWVEEIEWDEAEVGVMLTREQVRQSPEYDPDEPVTREYESALYAYYGMPGYWEGDF